VDCITAFSVGRLLAGLQQNLFEPFDSDQFIFELKIDGFRALAHSDAGKEQLISRNGNTFHGSADLAPG